jgi:hypothetical protein
MIQERQIYKDIKTDCYYSVKTGIIDYASDDMIPNYMLFAAEYSTLRVFEFLYELVLEKKSNFKKSNLFEAVIKNKNIDILLYLLKRIENDLKTNYFSINFLVCVYKDEIKRTQHLKKVIDILKENKTYEKIKKEIDDEKLLNFLNIHEKIDKF